jgi:hypothetical protein
MIWYDIISKNNWYFQGLYHVCQKFLVGGEYSGVLILMKRCRGNNGQQYPWEYHYEWIWNRILRVSFSKLMNFYWKIKIYIEEIDQKVTVFYQWNIFANPVFWHDVLVLLRGYYRRKYWQNNSNKFNSWNKSCKKNLCRRSVTIRHLSCSSALPGHNAFVVRKVSSRIQNRELHSQ